MLSSLKKHFSRFAPSKAGHPAEWDDIPRYPPFAKGFPVVPTRQVMATQEELIERLRNALGFNKEQFGELVIPVIARYVGFVHLLPASEAHHHRGAGGLFRHGLEVAFWAAQASEAVIFTMEGSPRERRNNEPRWRLACALAGIMHDLGKPLSDVAISDRSGEKHWRPYRKDLYSWAKDEKIDRYFLRWRDDRHRMHEDFTMMQVRSIIGDDVMDYLDEGGPRIIADMLAAIEGKGLNLPISRLVMKADQESVARDLKANRIVNGEQNLGVPVASYIIDALRRLVKKRIWRVNEAGAQVWHMEQGSFLVWRTLDDMHELLKKDGLPAIPQDPDSVADILLDHGYAVPKPVDDGTGQQSHVRYWEICPDLIQRDGCQQIKLKVLRLEDSGHLFTTQPPEAVKGKVIGEEEPDIVFEDIEETTVEAEVEAAEPANEGVQQPGTTGSREEQSTKGARQAPIEAPPQEEAQPGEPLYPETPAAPSTAGASPEGNDTADIDLDKLGMDDPFFFGSPADHPNAITPIGTVAEQAPSAHEATKNVDGGDFTDNEGGSSPKEAGKESTGVSPSMRAQSARAQLDAALRGLDDSISSLMMILIKPVLNGERLLGEVLCRFKGQAAVVYPDGAEELGEPALILSMFKEAGLLAPDPVMDTRMVQSHQGMKAMVFVREWSDMIIAALNEAEQEEPSLAEVLISASAWKRPGRPAEQQPANLEQDPPNALPEQTGNTDEPLACEPRQTAANTRNTSPEQSGSRNNRNKGKTRKGNPQAARTVTSEQNTISPSPRKAKTPPGQSNHQQKISYRSAGQRVPGTDSTKGFQQQPAQGPSNQNKKAKAGKRSLRQQPRKLAAEPVEVDLVAKPRNPQLNIELPGRGKQPTVEQMVNELRRQITEGKGPWIAGKVERDGNELVVSGKALDKIAGVYDVAKRELRLFIATRSGNMRYSGGQIRLTLD